MWWPFLPKSGVLSWYLVKFQICLCISLLFIFLKFIDYFKVIKIMSVLLVKAEMLPKNQSYSKYCSSYEHGLWQIISTTTESLSLPSFHCHFPSFRGKNSTGILSYDLYFMCMYVHVCILGDAYICGWICARVGVCRCADKRWTSSPKLLCNWRTVPFIEWLEIYSILHHCMWYSWVNGF